MRRAGLLLLALALAARCLGDAPADNPPPRQPAADDFDDYDYAAASVTVSDPFESWNRAVFKFNDAAYAAVVRPVADTYVKIVPSLPRRGISNFFENLRAPLRLAANLLQGDLAQAGRELGKFAVNTTAGLAGLAKVSEKIPPLADGARPLADTAQTLGFYGIPAGPFFVIPLAGPMTARDAAGYVGDYYASPFSWDGLRHTLVLRWWFYTAAGSVNALNGLPGLLAAYDLAVKSAIDPYVAMRDAYVQYRDAMLKKRPPPAPPGLRRPGPRGHFVRPLLLAKPAPASSPEETAASTGKTP
ncbi:MAG: VacJ family lipoprotein [Opitutaceae bacterium]|jgi:phospholipid-binding lipoprotein MlaA|nr:VacJ family lipoprotein [Opitutaceae bacterium]